MHVNKKYSEVKSLTGLEIINLYGLADPNVEVMAFLSGEFMSLEAFAAMPLALEDTISGYHSVRLVTASEAFYRVGDIFYSCENQYILAEVSFGPPEYAMIDNNSGRRLKNSLIAHKSDSFSQSDVFWMFGRKSFDCIIQQGK